MTATTEAPAAAAPAAPAVDVKKTAAADGESEVGGMRTEEDGEEWPTV